jgi:hypothetical protein
VEQRHFFDLVLRAHELRDRLSGELARIGTDELAAATRDDGVHALRRNLDMARALARRSLVESPTDWREGIVHRLRELGMEPEQ